MPEPQPLSVSSGLLDTCHDEAMTVLYNLTEKNHKKNCLLFKKVLHNHTQHGLLAAYLLGGSGAKLDEIYQEETKGLEPRKGMKPANIFSEVDINQLLGHLEHEVDFMIYFETLQHTSGLDTWQIAQYWLLDREMPFLPGLIGGYAHPLIMLADAVELNSSTLVFDSLALTAVDWNSLTTLITMDLPVPLTHPYSLAELLDAIRCDSIFDGVVMQIGIEHTTSLLQNKAAASAIVGYLSLGDSYLSGSRSTLQVTEEMVELATLLLMCTHVPGKPAFDFYLNHNLCFVNCLRILLPAFGRAEEKRTLMRIYWLLTVLAFITQGRPAITPHLLETKNPVRFVPSWGQVKKSALDPTASINPSRASDAHFLKSVQIMSTFAIEFEAKEPLLLAAAGRFVGEFEDWTGFGESQLNIDRVSS